MQHYKIKWQDSKRGTKGISKFEWKRAEVELLIKQFNLEHPHILHEPDPPFPSFNAPFPNESSPPNPV